MSRLDCIIRMFQAIDGSDWPALLDLYSPSCTYDRPGYPRIEGLADLDNFYRHERRIGSGQHRVLDSFDKPGRLVVEGDFTGTARTGEPLAAEFVDIYTFDGSLIAARRTYFYAALV